MADAGFNNNDYLNMIIIYGECNKVVKRTCETFIQRYPDRPRPTRDTVKRLLQNLQNFGSFKGKYERDKSVVNNEENEVMVLAYFRAHPYASLRDAERDIGLKKSSIQNILHKHKFNPYAIHLCQNLKEDDFERRVHFCELILTKHQEDENFLRNIIWTDESKFTKNGLFNRHNSHYWSDVNPHIVREHNFQTSWKFNVFCAIRNDSIVMVKFYDNNLTGDSYLEILNELRNQYLNILPANERMQLWYQHDGAPPHRTLFINQFLTENFEDRWVANLEAFLWQPRSPDLTHLDFFIWGYIKNQVFATPLTAAEECQERVRMSIQSIPAETIQKATTATVLRRCDKCSRANGGLFEQHL